MAGETIQAKAERMSRISHLLYRHPHGLSVAELARLCEVTKRTIQRDLRSLERAGVPLRGEGDPPRYGVIEGYYLPPIHLTLDDALALFLAARLLARYADNFDPHIAEALAKLAGILPETIARHVHATIRCLVTREDDERFVRVLGRLATGLAGGRKVRIAYRAAQSENVHEYLLCPYFVEPSGEGKATHVIGHASYFNRVTTFKVERILAAELTQEHYEIPADFDGPALLDSAWGIMFGAEREEVLLRFAASATQRVKETHWHPSQTLEDLPDGGCILRLRVAHPEEMRYWIMGWGGQVEVLAPTGLRAEVAGETRRMGEVYGRSNQDGNQQAK